jgi:hypothetical protein
MIVIAATDKNGLEVDVDELGSDTMCEGKPLPLGCLNNIASPLSVVDVNLMG